MLVIFVVGLALATGDALAQLRVTVTTRAVVIGPGDANGQVKAEPASAPADSPAAGPASRTASGSASRPATKPATTGSRPATASAPAPPSLEAARKLYWTGKYEEAIAMYRKLAESDSRENRGQALISQTARNWSQSPLPGAIGLSSAYMAVGKYAEAQKALSDVSSQGETDPDWRLAIADALSAVGKYEQALDHARAALVMRPDWAPAMFAVGQTLETLGKKADAIEVYKTMDKAVAKEGYKRDARTLVACGQILDRFAILTGRKASEQASNIMKNYFDEADQAADKTYWPAHVAAGAFLLSKHFVNQAGAELAKADKLNPRLPEVFVGRGVLLLGQFQFEKVMELADKALAINPNHADALLLKAACMMVWRKLDQIAPCLDKVLAVNPNHLEALSMMAALHVRNGQEDKAKIYIDRAEKIHPRYGELYGTVGEWLNAARQFKDAQRYLTQAIELSPELAGPVTELGLVYMQTGQEELAKKTLDKAFSLDDYRADVINYRDLLTKLEGFQTRTTAHFIIRVEGKQDGVLLDWLADVAERVATEVCQDFNHTPPNKIVLEMFPDHSSFSVRITGRGWIGTIGACTGGVIAMPAPDPLRGGFGTFNWAVVLRHEYTHAVTLSLTENRIPHWFTEACAVWEQPDRRNFEAVAMLVEAVRDGKLFPAKQLDWGFIRPKSGGARSLAYAQSELIFEYIVETKGFDTIGKMLNGFRDRWSQERVFKDVLGASEEQFDKDFRAWATAQVKSWHFDPKPFIDLAAAQKEAKDKPTSAEAQANLAAACLHNRRVAEAEAAARKALGLDAKNTVALRVLGSILTLNKKWDEAIQIGHRLEEIDPTSPRAARILADCYLARHEWEKAVPALEAYKKRLPDDSFGYEQLAKLYQQMGQQEEALPNLAEMHRRTLKDFTYARQVADIYRTAGKVSDALDWYEQVIQINPYDAGTYKTMASLSLRIKRNDRAVLAMHSACLLEPENADTWSQMAMVDYRVGIEEKSSARLADGKAAAKKALALDPNSQAKEVLGMIEKAEGATTMPQP